MTAAARKDVILSLSTEVAPAKHIEVDGVEYDLLSLEHLSKVQEARVIYLFRRNDRLMRVLDETDDDKLARKTAEELPKVRTELLTTVTTLPTEIADKLPLTAANKVLEAFAENAGFGGAE